MLTAHTPHGVPAYYLDSEDNRFLGELVQGLRYQMGSGNMVAEAINQMRQLQFGEPAQLRVKIDALEQLLGQRTQHEAAVRTEIEQVRALVDDLAARIDKLNPNFGRF